MLHFMEPGEKNRNINVSGFVPFCLWLYRVGEI